MPSREFVLQLLGEAGEPVDAEDLAFRLGLEAEEYDSFFNRLRAMQREGQLLFNRRGALCLPEKIEVKAGRYRGPGPSRAARSFIETYSPVAFGVINASERCDEDLGGVPLLIRRPWEIGELLARLG